MYMKTEKKRATKQSNAMHSNEGQSRKAETDCMLIRLNCQIVSSMEYTTGATHLLYCLWDMPWITWTEQANFNEANVMVYLVSLKLKKKDVEA